MTPDQRALAVDRSRSLAQTDCITVVFDLTRASQAVADAAVDTLSLEKQSFRSGGADGFDERLGQHFLTLKNKNEDEAFEFVVLLSAFVHECRHVHDLRGTWLGAELLLNEYSAYWNTYELWPHLRRWCEQGKVLPVPPLAPTALWVNRDLAELCGALDVAAAKKIEIAGWWKSRRLADPSLKELVECLAFCVQTNWVERTFGREYAEDIWKATVEDGKGPDSEYIQPIRTLVGLCEARGVRFDPEDHDVPLMIFAALNVSSSAEAFGGTSNGDAHPGRRFVQIAEIYVDLHRHLDIPAAHRAEAAIGVALAGHGYNLRERYEHGSDAINVLQAAVMQRSLDHATLKWGPGPILLATESAIDFRAIQHHALSALAYHTGPGYVRLLMDGELPLIPVRLRTHQTGGSDLFATPGAGNHLGGYASASEAAQIAKILIFGRQVLPTSFFEEETWQLLKSSPPGGFGLKFHRR